ncbi:hypothetical protein BDN70DRAFT_936171 [Pholiota conissans]|uniref:Uncharacterized protein n=1 Tax=Pholiota conissans TaxID=109636 RepID=A0A9P6CWC5_9AGAR|nr:hypothetical protein BDN70DRAFT_936171 [Pholiota conissans]
MIFSRILLAAIAAAASLTTTTALPAGPVYVGHAMAAALGTTPCPVKCPGGLTDYRVALPSEMFPNGEHCCEKVQVTYKGISTDVTFTDLFMAAVHSQNISLSWEAFELLAPLEGGAIFPVFWTFVSS